jgi:hypothetical protein
MAVSEHGAKRVGSVGWVASCIGTVCPPVVLVGFHPIAESHGVGHSFNGVMLGWLLVVSEWRESVLILGVKPQCVSHAGVTSAKLLSVPFQCCILPDFISATSSVDEERQTGGAASDDTPGKVSAVQPEGVSVPVAGVESRATSRKAELFLRQLVSELLKLKFYEKNNDLYQFHQVCCKERVPIYQVERLARYTYRCRAGIVLCFECASSWQPGYHQQQHQSCNVRAAPIFVQCASNRAMCEQSCNVRAAPIV